MTTSPMMRALVALGATVVATLAAIALIPAGIADWVKALHVLAIISWMAGMLYLPRLFVYHCGVPVGSEASETFKVMEARLLHYIINPAMIVAWITGLWLAWVVFGFRGGWLHGKLLLVLLLSAAHGYLSAARRAFAEDRNTRDHRHWRIVNEVPTALMVGIVILVIVKPF
jgi:putative membrane protein